MFRGRSLSHIDAGLDVVQVQVPDDVVHGGVLQTFWPVVGRGQSLSHTQLELTVGQFCCLKAFLKQGAVIKNTSYASKSETIQLESSNNDDDPLHPNR